jgi:predicted dehydrogenase
MANLGIGIIGLGMGRSLLPINGDPSFPATVRGVCDVRLERVDAAKAEHGIEFGTDSYDALLDRSDIDIIAVYTPDGLHRDQTVQALEAGKHVFVTKPMTVSTEESEAVVEAARRTGKRVMPAQTFRYVLPHLTAKKFIDQGDFGDIYFVTADYYQDLRPVYDYSPWRYEIPQDFVYGGLSHNIDTMRFLKGEIVEVAAFGSYSGLDDRYPRDKFETFVVNVKFEDGTLGRIAMAPCVRPPLPNIYIQVFGTSGTFVENQIVLDGIEGRPTIDFDYAQEAPAAGERRAARNFVESIIADVPQDLNEVDGARITAVGDAIWESIGAGGAPTKVRLDF